MSKLTKQIKTDLDELARVDKKVHQIRSHYEQLRGEVLTPNIIIMLGDIDVELKSELDGPLIKARELTDKIKADTIAAGLRVDGSIYKAIFVKGRQSWDSRALDGYAEAHPEIKQFKKVGNPSARIQTG